MIKGTPFADLLKIVDFERFHRFRVFQVLNFGPPLGKNTPKNIILKQISLPFSNTAESYNTET